MRRTNWLVIFLIGFILIGCQKSERDEDVLTNTSEENALAEAIYSDAFRMIHKAALNTQGISNTTGQITTLFGCDTIVNDTDRTIKNLFIDFGFDECIASYGINRKGRIIADFTGVYPEENSIVNIIFLNYNFGIHKVDGNITIVNRGPNNEGNPIITFFLQDGTISNNFGTIQWQANKTWEMTEGYNTSTVTDDKFLITGTSFGFNQKGNEFDTEVTTDNLVEYECLQISAGTQDVNVKNLSKRFIDYGSGGCDRAARVNINGAFYDIVLRQ